MYPNTDDTYCHFCGDDRDEENNQKIHECDGGWCCDTCCDALTSEWLEYREGSGDYDLEYVDWLKMSQPDRILKIDWEEGEFEQLTAMATAAGQTPEQFMTDVLIKWAEEQGGGVTQ